MQKGRLSLKICLAGLLVLAMVRHFAAAQGHGYHHHGTGRPSGRPPPRRTRPRGGIPSRHHSWSGSGAPPTRWHHSHPTGKHPKPKAVWVLVQFEITNPKWEKDFENKNSKSYKTFGNYIAKNFKDSPYARMLKEVHFKYFKKGTKGVVAVLAFSVLPPPPPKRGKKRDPSKRMKEMLKRIFYESGIKIDPNSILVTPIKPKGIKQGKKHRIFEGVIRLLEVWKKSLEDIRSADSQRLAKRLHAAMVKVFGKELFALKLDKLRKGSIIVDFHLAFNSSMSGSATDVRLKLEKQIEDGQLGDMKVDKTSLKFAEIVEEQGDHDKLTEDKDHRRHLSPEAKAAIVVVALVLVCLCITVGIWYFVKRNNSQKQDSAVQEFDNPVKFGSASVA